MGANMTYTHNIGSVIRFSGTTTGNTITTNGKIMRSITINGSGGGWTLQDALTQSPGVFNFSWGTLNTNGMTITCPTNFSVTGTAARTLTLGASSIILNGTGTQFDATTTTNLTFNPNTSTITATNTSATAKTFIGGNLTFNDLTISGDNITISGNNIFNTLAVNNGGRTNGLIFTAGSTQTVSFFTTNGSSGSLAIIKSSSAGSAATLTAATAGQVSVDYMSIKDSTATGGAGWYAGANSTNVSGNTGWTFTIPPTTTQTALSNTRIKLLGISYNALSYVRIKLLNLTNSALQVVRVKLLGLSYSALSRLYIALITTTQSVISTLRIKKIISQAAVSKLRVGLLGLSFLKMDSRPKRFKEQAKEFFYGRLGRFTSKNR